MRNTIELKKNWVVIGVVILTGLFVLYLAVFNEMGSQLSRDNESNIFKEIKILKEKNEDLGKEVEDLENTLVQLADQHSALEAIQEEIDKYKTLSGGYSVFGPGISVSITGDLPIPWIVDLINEFFNSGAEAVSINGIRIINETIGFDSLPQDKVLINGVVIREPYTFDVIGEASDLIAILELPGGIFARLSSALPYLDIDVKEKDIIQMD